MNPNPKETEGLRRSSRKKKGDQEPEDRLFVTTRVDFTEESDQEIAGTSGTGGPGGAIPMARTFSRLKYRKFRGDGREDVDEWLSEFDATAAATKRMKLLNSGCFKGCSRKKRSSGTKRSRIT